MPLTILEMHTEFQELFDKMDSSLNPLLEAEQIDLLFNVVQRDFFKELIREGAENTQTAEDYLSALISDYRTTTFNLDTTNKANARYIDLPNNYKKALQEEATITYTDCHDVIRSKIVKVIPITHGEYNTGIEDPFKKPNLEKIRRLGTAKNSNGNWTFELLYSPNTTITNYYLRYYREPVDMSAGSLYPVVGPDVDCELNEEAKREIIKRAVSLASKALENFPKYQIEEQNIKLND